MMFVTGERLKKISDEDCAVLCNLMKSTQVKANQEQLDTSKDGAACLGDSFVSDPDAINIQHTSWIDMTTNWIDIEDDPDLIEDEIDEALEELDKIQIEESDDDNLEDDDETVTDNETASRTVSKTEALECIDKLKKYCEQKI